MPRKPEDFSNVEDRFKLTLLQIEKRFVDLEMGVSEIKNRMKEIEAAAALQQRIDDIEDLIMVEQAGINELKKMLEESASKQSPEQTPEVAEKLTQFEEKLSNLEKNIAGLVDKDELQQRLNKIDNDIAASAGNAMPTSIEMENVHGKMGDMQNGMNSFRNQTESTLRGLYEKIKELEAKEHVSQPGVDFDLLSSKIATVKVGLDEISKKMTENSLRMSEFDKRFEIVDNKIREAMSEQVLNEIKNNRKDIISTNVRLDSLERVARDIISSNQVIENSMKKFESIEKITSLGKDIEDKIERFKFVEEEIKRLSSRIEMIYDSIDNRLEKVRSFDKKFEDFYNSLDKMKKDVDASRMMALSRVRKEDLKGIYESLDKLKKDADTNRMMILERVKREDLKNMTKVMEDFGKKTKPEDMNMLQASVEQRLSQIEGNYRRNVDRMMSSMQSQMSQFSKPSSAFDTQINELVNRLVFLETRLGAVENLMQEPSKVQPIILE